MKKHILVAAISLFSATVFAQKAPVYCDLDVYQPFLKNFIAVPNYGADNKKATKANAIKDGSGDIMKFRTQIQALNYMVKEGWELVSTYHKAGDEVHFYLKKVS